MESLMIVEVLIIGAGPASLTCALQLKRYGITARIMEKARPGGLLWNANLVENYPGFPAGISGADLVQLFLKQIQNLSIEVEQKSVLKLTWQAGFFQVQTNLDQFLARIVVIASGTKARRLPEGLVPNTLQQQVFYEILPLLERNVVDQTIAIIGAGDTAFDYALNLAKHNRVIILNRTQQLKCLPLLWQRASQNPNIEVHPKTQALQLNHEMDGRIALKCQQDNQTFDINVDYLIAAIGRQPALDFLDALPLEQSDHLQQQGRLYLIGDVKNEIYRQTAIAAGDGLLAAMKIYQTLKEQ
jgi:thioredoxin reductase (NADPH)